MVVSAALAWSEPAHGADLAISTAAPVIAALGQIDQSGGDLGTPSTEGSPVAFVLIGLAVIALGFCIWRGWLRLAASGTPGTATRPHIGPAVAICLLIGMLLLRQVGAAATAKLKGIQLGQDAAHQPTIADYAILLIGSTAAAAIGVIIYACVRHSAARKALNLGQPPQRMSALRASLIGLGALLVVFPLVSAASMLAAWIMGKPVPMIAHDLLQQLADAPRDAWWWTLVALVTLAGPVIEEVMYRGLLQQAIVEAGLRGWAAIAAASVIFSAMHWSIVEPQALAGLFVLSLGFGWAYEKTGRLAAPIVMHILFNAGNLVLALTTQDS